MGRVLSVTAVHSQLRAVRASGADQRGCSFARFFGETPSTSSATDPGKLVEREGLEPSTPAL